MIIYILALIILVYNTVRYDFNSKKDGLRNALIVEFVVLVLIAGFRYKVGGDTIGYMREWHRYPIITDLSNLKLSFVNERYSVLWVLLCSISKTVYDSFYLFQFVHAIIVNGCFIYFFAKYSKRPFLCILIYALFFYFNYNTEILRSALSASVFLISYQYLINRKLIKYYLLCLVAIGLHTESFVTLLFPLFLFLNSGNRIKTSIAIVFTASIIILNTVDLSALEMMQQIQYGTIEEFLSTEKATLNLNGIIAYSFNIVPLIILLLFTKDDNRFDIFLLFSIFIYVMTFKYTVIFSRMMDFIYPIIVVKIADFTIRPRKKLQLLQMKYFVLVSIVFVCYTYTWSRFYFSDIGGRSSQHDSYKFYFPYTSWIEEEEDEERHQLILIVR